MGCVGHVVSRWSFELTGLNFPVSAGVLAYLLTQQEKGGGVVLGAFCHCDPVANTNHLGEPYLTKLGEEMRIISRAK